MTGIATVVEDVLIEADAAHVWDAIRDVGAVHRRLIPGYVLDTRRDGDVQILPATEGRCRLVWTTDVLPNDMADQVRLRVSRDAQVMKETLEAA